MMTTIDNSPKTIAGIAKKIIVNTAEMSVPLTPQNYHVWFEYFQGSNKQLTAAVDALIVSNKHFSQEINEQLYTKYLNRDKKELLKEVHKETFKIFQNIFRATLSTNELTSDYSEKMEDYFNKLNDTDDLGQIQKFIEDIIRDTNNMAESSGQLSRQLREATSEIKTLSKQLEETEKEVLLDSLTGLNLGLRSVS